MHVLFTDYKQPNLDLEYALMRQAGIEMDAAQCHTPHEVIQAAGKATVLIANGAPITRLVIESLPQLQMISSVGIGVDHINLQAAEEQGVWVANVPSANVNEVSTHALAMALSLIRHLSAFDKSVRAGKWDKRCTGPLARPAQMTLGVLGLGHIGRALIPMAQPIFKRILGHDPYCPPQEWPNHVTPTGLSDLFAHSDVVSIHVPLNPKTQGLVDETLLMKMSGGYLVNTSRGPIVSESGLLNALESGSVTAAALDVLPQEPPPKDCALLNHPRIQISPHAAFYSLEAEDALRRGAVQNAIQWVNQGCVDHAVVRGRERVPL